MAGDTSRANGAKSRGPRTAQGKTRSSRNAVRHGLRSQRRGGADAARTGRMGLCHALSILGRTSTSLPLSSRSTSSRSTTSRSTSSRSRSCPSASSADVPPDLLAACIAFAQADDFILRCQAMKALAMTSTREALVLERNLRASWSGLIEACTGTDPDTPLAVHVQRAGLRITSGGVETLRTASMRDAMSSIARLFPLASAHLWLSSLDDRVVATAVCAKDIAVFDRYIDRAMGCRRKAMRVMRRHAALARARLSLAERDRVDAVVYAGVGDVPSYPTPSFDPDAVLHGMKSLMRTHPPINALGQVIRGHTGLQFAVCVRFQDLNDLSRHQDKACFAALSLGAYGLAGRSTRVAKAAVKRTATFFDIASKVLGITSIPAVISDIAMPKRDPEEQSKLLRQIVENLESWAERQQARGQDGIEADAAAPESAPTATSSNTGARTNAPSSAQHRSITGLDEHDHPSSLHDHARPAQIPRPSNLEEDARTAVVPNEPGRLPAPDFTTVRDEASPPTTTSQNAKSVILPNEPEPQPEPDRTTTLHARNHDGRFDHDPWLGVVPPERRGHGTMSSPLIKPPTLMTTSGPTVIHAPDGPSRTMARRTFSPPHHSPLDLAPASRASPNAPSTDRSTGRTINDPPRSPYGIRLEQPEHRRTTPRVGPKRKTID